MRARDRVSGRRAAVGPGAEPPTWSGTDRRVACSKEASPQGRLSLAHRTRRAAAAQARSAGLRRREQQPGRRRRCCLGRGPGAPCRRERTPPFPYRSWPNGSPLNTSTSAATRRSHSSAPAASSAKSARPPPGHGDPGQSRFHAALRGQWLGVSPWLWSRRSRVRVPSLTLQRKPAGRAGSESLGLLVRRQRGGDPDAGPSPIPSPKPGAVSPRQEAARAH